MTEYEKVRAECQLTPDEMVNAIWEAGNKYEADGGDIEKVDQALRFSWISEATINKALKHPSILIKHPNQELPGIIVYGKDIKCQSLDLIKIQKNFGQRMVAI